MNLSLGRAKFDTLAYASQANAVLGIRGSGKTYSATYIAERLMDAGIPIVALDPIGLWRFLRVPGAGKGYPVVVAGGEHGDLPLPPHGAAEIMRAAMRDGVSIVFDLYDIQLSKRQWREIVEAVVRVLLYENKAHGLRHVFLEEAAEFIPQRIGPDQGAVYSVVERLARMGGNAQLGLTLINQRGEEVNKAVLDLCDLLVLHRQKGRNSLLNLGKWMDVASVANRKEIGEKVPLLKNGEAFVWPAESATPILTKIPEKKTYHPDRKAMKQAIAAESKRVDVGAFVKTMKGSLEKLAKEAEANDQKKLKAQIVELRAELAKAGHTPPADLDVMLSAARNRGLADGYGQAQADVAKAVAPIMGLRTMPLSDTLKVVHEALVRVPPALLKVQNRPQPALAPLQSRATPASVASAGNGQLPKAERLILTALAQYPEGCKKTKVAIVAGYAVNGGAFNNSLGALRSRGWITRGEPIQITEAGLRELGDFSPLPTGRELLDHWLGNLGKAERQILKALAESYPKSLNKQQIAVAAGYEANGGAFNNALGRLRTLTLIKGRGDIKASEELFGLGESCRG